MHFDTVFPDQPDRTTDNTFFPTDSIAMILQPNLGSLAEEFPNLSYSTVTMIITVSALFLGIAALASGKIAGIIGKKKLLIIGSILFGCGGCLTSVMPSFTLIILCRLIEGLGAGFVITVSMTLIPELFPDEKEGNQILGMNAVATALWGTFIGTAAGYLWKMRNIIAGAAMAAPAKFISISIIALSFRYICVTLHDNFFHIIHRFIKHISDFRQ